MAPSLDHVAEALAAAPNDVLVDRNDWVRLARAIKCACDGSEEGYALFEEWSLSDAHPKNDHNTVRALWDSLHPPHHIGWDQLARWACDKSDGAFSTAGDEFDCAAAEVGYSDTESLTEAQSIVKTMTSRYVYREPSREWVRLADAKIMKTEAFSDTRDGLSAARVMNKERLNGWKAWEAPEGSEEPRPEKPKPQNAHDILKDKVRAIQDITYMPAKPKLFAGAFGDMLNLYDPPARPFQQVEVTASDVAPFLKLLGWVFPNETERALVLDWMSYIAQNPGRKVQWAPVFFSRTHGVGKDLLLKVLRYGVVGKHNMKSIAPSRIDGEFNADWAAKQVVLVTELPSFQKRDLYDKLKDFVASGAGSLTVNPKNHAQFEVPNNHCWVFTTNKPDALSLDVQDRRFVVLQAREARMPKDLRDELYAFFDYDDDTDSGSARGFLLAGEWMKRRALSAAFDPHECRLLTAAKEAMMVETLAPGAALLYEALTEGEWSGRRTVRLSECRAVAARAGGRLASFAEVRKGLELTGFALPARRDTRDRINIGPRKLEVWVRDLPVAESEPLRSVQMAERSQSKIAEILVSEIRTYSTFEAAEFERLLEQGRPKVVEMD